MNDKWNRLDRLRPTVDGEYRVLHTDALKEVLRYDCSMQAFMVRTGGSEDCPISTTVETIVAWQEIENEL